MTISLDTIYRNIPRNGEPHYGIARTPNAIADYGIDMDPDFQRGVVWTVEQQENFVGHLLEGGETNPVLINSGPRGDNISMPVLDGLQRITACLRWSRGEIGGRLTDGRLIMLADLDEVSRRRCNMQIGLRYGVVRLSRADMLWHYIRLNRGGTVHTDQEIERVRAMLAAETER